MALKYVSLATGKDKILDKNIIVDKSFIKLSDLGFTGPDQDRYIQIQKLKYVENGIEHNISDSDTLNRVLNMATDANLSFSYITESGEKIVSNSARKETVVVHYYYDKSNSINETVDIKPIKDNKDITISRGFRFNIVVDKTWVSVNASDITLDGKSIIGAKISDLYNGNKLKDSIECKRGETVVSVTQIGVNYYSTREPLMMEVDPATRYTSNQTSATRTTADGKTEYVIKAHNYEQAPDGNLVALTIGGKTQFVNLSSLYKYELRAGNRMEYVPLFKPGDSIEQVLADYSDQELYVLDPSSSKYEKTDSVVVKSTLNTRYKRMIYMQETSDTKDILAEGTYLRLKNGKYVVERDVVRPLTYTYAAGEQEASAYLFNVKVGDKTYPYISRKPSIKVKIDGKVYNLPKGSGVPLKLTDVELDQADIIQTTNENLNGVHACTVLKLQNGSPVSANAEDVAAMRDKALAGFDAAYKSGKYIVNEVYVKGKDGKPKLEPLLSGTRYKQGNEVTLPDEAANNSEYDFSKSNEVKFVDGKLVDHPVFSMKKSLAKDFGNKDVKSLYGNLALFALGGSLFLGPAAPILAAAVLGPMSIGILGKAVIKKIQSVTNKNKIKYVDHVKVNRTAVKKSLNEEMQSFYESCEENYARLTEVKKAITELSETQRIIQGMETATQKKREDVEYAGLSEDVRSDLAKFKRSLAGLSGEDLKKRTAEYEEELKKAHQAAKAQNPKKYKSSVDRHEKALERAENEYWAEHKEEFNKIKKGYQKKSSQQIQEEIDVEIKKQEEIEEVFNSANFRETFNRFEQSTAVLGATTSDVTFEMVNGKGSVTPANVHLFEEYKKKVKEAEKVYKRALKDKKKHPQAFEEAKAALDEIRKNCVIREEPAEADRELPTYDKKVRNMRSFMWRKYFGETKTIKLKSGEELEIDKLRLDPTTGKYLYKGKEMKLNLTVEGYDQGVVSVVEAGHEHNHKGKKQIFKVIKKKKNQVNEAGVGSSVIKNEDKLKKNNNGEHLITSV